MLYMLNFELNKTRNIIVNMLLESLDDFLGYRGPKWRPRLIENGIILFTSIRKVADDTGLLCELCILLSEQ